MDRINELVDVLSSVCGHNEELSMGEYLSLLDIKGILLAIKEQGSITLQEVQDEH